MSGERALAADPNAAGGVVSTQGASRRRQEPFDSSELPFLVTHWLRNFPSNNQNQEGSASAATNSAERQAALDRIQRAAGDLASAFSALGAFGSSTVASLNLSVEHHQQQPTETTTTRNATFDDLNRQWASVLPGNHLNNLVNAAATTAIATEDVVDHCAPSNLVDAANEAIHEQRRNPASGRTMQDAIHEQRRNPASGRTKHDAIDLEQQDENTTTNNTNEAEIVPVKPSILQPPARLDFNFAQSNDDQAATTTSNNSRQMPSLESEMKDLQQKSSQAMRSYLELKVTFQNEEEEIRKLSSSLELHEQTKQSLRESRLSTGASTDDTEMILSEEEQNADRVIAQLQRKLGDLVPSHAKTKQDLAIAKEQAYSNYSKAKKSFLGHRDPFCDAARRRPGFGANVAHNNVILRSLENRRLGLQNRQSLANVHQGLQQPNLTGTRIRKVLLESRLSHALTVNSHLHYPVYSVRFDRTGRYFVTGADDSLVRVFCLGAKQRIDNTGRGVLPDQDQTIRGAVLVCTLKGHASVINAIDISSDNCFIATASDDWDCRVWGLKDGAPVAILRGHAGGCHMIRWSTLTPYRLVTAGDDGLARTWDIREAALKRYGSVIGKRPEYALRLTREERASSSQEDAETEARLPEEPQVALPPIPDRPTQADGAGDSAANANQAAALPEQPLPPPPEQPLPPPLPLPPPGDGGAVPVADGNNNNNNNNADGANEDANNLINEAIAQRRFVTNNNIDEGVKLLAKFQHGASLEERMAAPGTRSRRAPVRILCLVRCPFGGHFATGASDGICRIWCDEDDLDVETVDRRSCKSAFDWINDTVRSSEKPVRRTSQVSQSKLILQLKGHLNAITDLQYSHAGDRIMTGSQMDGVVRIWSWDVDPSVPDSRLQSKDRGMRSIVIKLTNPMAATANEPKKSRRRVGAGTASKESKIQLDVAVWTHDDSKIITSQSQMIREGKMQPDTNFIFMWDTQTGHCLLGIVGAHSLNCQVILPHPTNESVFCSAGLDGYMKVWDVESGKCIFSHKNDALFSQGDGADKGGWLDGCCFPDGTGYVLTDNSGSVCVFDSILTAAQQKASNDPSSVPSLPAPESWLKEQYFSNDYYDLYYDSTGYCVEQGSELPPHLAPRGVRCSHSGASFPNTATITEAFRKLARPMPAPVRDCQWLRESLRSRARLARTKLRVSSKHKRANIMQEYDPLTTVLVRSSGQVIQTRNERGEIVIPTTLTNVVASPSANRQMASPIRRASDNEPRRSAYSGRQLSSNYRYLDYSDMLQRERDFDEDSDDEEFEPAPRNTGRASARRADSDEESEDLNEDYFEEESPQRRSTSRQPTSRQAASRQPASRQPTSRQRQSTGASRQRQPSTTRRAAEAAATEEAPQPSRASRRRLVLQRGRYHESDDEADREEDQLLSTNNDPTGPHVEDYNTFLFKLPPSGPRIARQWLRRTESDMGYQGAKVYAPQIGDSVVYLPRAHFETLQSFASMKVPYHDWPPEAEWPVVCCCIRDIRYRFPYINFYGGRNAQRRTQCTSVVAILTLEVTGIPVGQQDYFNWQDPHFIPPARSHIFEVGMFQSEHEEYVIPFDRYVWRLQCLQEAIVSKHFVCEGIEISVYFEEDSQGEDAELHRYAGKLENYGQPDIEHNDANLNNTGYEAIRIGWGDSHEHNNVNPWDVIVDRPKSKVHSLSRPCLDDSEKQRAKDALENLKRIPQVRDHFECPVNQRQYIDYSDRVEVPMHIGIVHERLEHNYYSSRMSIVADIRLIRDNCIKYNGEVGGLQDRAREMYEQFETEMLSEDERKLFKDLKITIASSTVQESTRTRSSLENLPPPAGNDESGSSNRRRSLRIRIDSTQIRASEAAAAPTQPTRALRSNSEVSNEAAPSASFANAMARGRQSRRSSNDNGASAAGGGRRDRGRARGGSNRPDPVQPQVPVPPGIRRSSRTRGIQPNPELPAAVANNVARARTSNVAGNGAAASARSSRARRRSSAAQSQSPPTQEAMSESEESDKKPPARQTRNSRRASLPKEEDVESEPEQQPSPQASNPQATRRSSRARTVTKRYDDESEPEEEEKPSPSYPRKRSARRSPPEIAVKEEEDSSEQESDEDDEREELEEEDQSVSESEAPSPPESRATRRPSRSAQRRSSVATNSSSRQQRRSSVATTASRASRRDSQGTVASSTRRSSRGSRVASYADHSGSEFSDIGEPSESEEEEKPQRRSPPKKRARGGSARSKPKASPKKRKSPAKRPAKRKREESDDELEEEDDDFSVDREPLPSKRKRTKIWHEIDQKHITRVTKHILGFFRSMDEEGIFAIPVIEAVPDVKQVYRQQIATPMDFRTIEEDRIHYYSSITELQKDLILVFQNCIDFNGTLSDFGQFAQKLLGMMDDAFEQAVAKVRGA